MVNGHVETISPDAAELPDTRERDGKRFRVSAGMLVSAEVNIASRTMMEHRLSPVRRSRMKRGGRGRWAIFQARLRAYTSKAPLDVDEFHT